jgi:hypothetical protein
MTVQTFKAKLIDNEIRDYVKSIEIEYEGVTYFADLRYGVHDGYELRFHDADGKSISDPDWVDNYDNGQRSIEGDLDEQTGTYRLIKEEQVIVTTDWAEQ